jgi:hypothetical protein
MSIVLLCMMFSSDLLQSFNARSPRPVSSLAPVGTKSLVGRYLPHPSSRCSGKILIWPRRGLKRCSSEKKSMKSGA